MIFKYRRGSFTDTVLVMLAFVSLYTFFLFSVPSEVANSGTVISSSSVTIPNDWIWSTKYNYIGSAHNITFNAPAWNYYGGFPWTMTNNTWKVADDRYYFANWDYWNDKVTLTSHSNPAGYNVPTQYISYYPTITRSMAISEFNTKSNSSEFEVKSSKETVILRFSDYNSTRNSIASSWDDQKMTLYILSYNHNATTSTSLNELYGGAQLVLNLATFRLGNAYESVSPELSFILSLVFYIPIILAGLWVYSIVVHGGGV